MQGGADANAEDAGGQKAIHAAAAEQHQGIVELLLPLTAPDADSPHAWTVDGIIQEAQQAIADDEPQHGAYEVCCFAGSKIAVQLAGAHLATPNFLQRKACDAVV